MQAIQINCPYGHGEMRPGVVQQETDCRGRTISYPLDCYVCPVCDLTRATVQQTTAAQVRVADLYRRKVGLLTGTQIKRYRERLGLSQQQLAVRARCAKMSIIRWENGSIQKEASDTALRGILCPADQADEFTGNRRLSLARIRMVLEEFERHVSYQLLVPGDRGVYTAKNCWYGDWVAYRELGKGLTGAGYSVLPQGPQLDNFADLIEVIAAVDPTAAEPLSAVEKAIIKRLAATFPRQKDAFDAALAEPVWQELKSSCGSRISYQTAFKLQAA